MTQPSWRSRIENACTSRAEPVVGHTFVKSWQTASKPVLLECENGKEYVVKGANAGRMLINDHITGLIGQRLGAPVPEICPVMIPDELISNEPQMSHMTPGVAHGSLYIEHVTERAAIDHSDVPGNRHRFALLSVLYGLVVANDHQFIYQNSEPHLVYSVDHGHFFPNGPNWTIANLNGAADPTPDNQIVSQCSLTKEELRDSILELKRLTDKVIVTIVAAPPEEWGLTMEERIEVAKYLARRRDLLQDHLEDKNGQ